MALHDLRPLGYKGSHWYSTAAAYYATVTGELTDIHPALRPHHVEPTGPEAEEAKRLRRAVDEALADWGGRESTMSDVPTDDQSITSPPSSSEARALAPHTEFDTTERLRRQNEHLTQLLESDDDATADTDQPLKPHRSIRRKKGFYVQRKPLPTVPADPPAVTVIMRVQTISGKWTEVRERRELPVVEASEKKPKLWSVEPEDPKGGRRPSVAAKWKDYSRKCREAWNS